MATLIVTPSDGAQNDMKSVAYIRQNPWSKMEDDYKMNSVRLHRKFHIPWVHTKETVAKYLENPGGFQPELNGDIHGYAKICIGLAVGSLVLIPNGKIGLIVRITSDVKAGVIDSLCIACSPRTCGHSNVHGSHSCPTCSTSVQEVFSSSNTQKIIKYLKNGCNIEAFWSLYREVEIVAHANYDGTDARKIAGMASVSKSIRYWKFN